MEVLTSVLTVLFGILCFLLIIIVLLQTDRNAGMGIFGGSSQSAFGSSTVDVITKIVSVGGDVDKRSFELDQSLRNDFESKKQGLHDIVVKKEQIREQGLKLANLYDKYQEREAHLINIMQRIEYMMKKGGAQPPDGRA